MADFFTFTCTIGSVRAMPHFDVRQQLNTIEHYENFYP